jgi:hypothetical protein
MVTQRVSTILALVMLTMTAAPALGQSEREGEWIQLFNGENLDGWRPKIRGHEPGDNAMDTFRVENGLLKVSYENYDQFDGRFGHLFYEGTFSHYVLRAEYRFTGEQVEGGPGWAMRNNGLMLHGESPEEMKIDQNFPASLELQLLARTEPGEDRPTGNLCTPLTHVERHGELQTQPSHESQADTYDPDQWVTVTAVIRGSELLKHVIEGKTAITYTKPQYDTSEEHGQALAEKHGKIIEGGTISIQAESHPTEFRKIEVKPLSPDAPIDANARLEAAGAQVAACCGR